MDQTQQINIKVNYYNATAVHHWKEGYSYIYRKSVPLMIFDNQS